MEIIIELYLQTCVIGQPVSSTRTKKLRWASDDNIRQFSTSDDVIKFRHHSTLKATLSTMWDNLLEGSSLHGIRFLHG